MGRPYYLENFLASVPCATCMASNPLDCPHRRFLTYSEGEAYYIDFTARVIDEAPHCTKLHIYVQSETGAVVKYPICLRGIGIKPRVVKH